MPNEIFLLGLSPGTLAVYSYLLCCENRSTYQCWPSYKTIGGAVKMSANTVRKYVCELEERQLSVTACAPLYGLVGVQGVTAAVFSAGPGRDILKYCAAKQRIKVLKKVVAIPADVWYVLMLQRS